MNSIIEKSPNALSDVTDSRRSFNSGTENAAFATPIPGALCRM